MGPRLATTNWARLMNVEAPAAMEPALRKKAEAAFKPVLVKRPTPMVLAGLPRTLRTFRVAS